MKTKMLLEKLIKFLQKCRLLSLPDMAPYKLIFQNGGQRVIVSTRDRQRIKVGDWTLGTVWWNEKTEGFSISLHMECNVIHQDGKISEGFCGLEHHIATFVWKLQAGDRLQYARWFDHRPALGTFPELLVQYE